MISMIDRLTDLPIIACMQRGNKPESVPADCIVLMIAEIWISTTADHSITIFILNLILIIKSLIQTENRPFQWFSRFIIILIKLDIIIRFPVLFMTENLKIQRTFCFTGSPAANCRIEAGLSQLQLLLNIQKNTPLVTF